MSYFRRSVQRASWMKIARKALQSSPSLPDISIRALHTCCASTLAWRSNSNNNSNNKKNNNISSSSSINPRLVKSSRHAQCRALHAETSSQGKASCFSHRTSRADYTCSGKQSDTFPRHARWVTKRNASRSWHGISRDLHISTPVAQSFAGASSIRDLHIFSPLVESDVLSKLVGLPVLMKLELLQPSGSFKIRGMSRRCRQVCEEGSTKLVSSSGGNAGLAIATVGRSMCLPVTVVVPTSTPQYMREKLAAQGAEVLVSGAVWNEANETAKQIVQRDPKAALVHPFDHPDIWAGHASMVREIYQQLAERQKKPSGETTSCWPAAVVAVVGGGGLLGGLMTGMEQVGWGGVPLVAVETEGAHSFNLAMTRGHAASLQAITSVAKSLGALQISEGVRLMAEARKAKYGAQAVRSVLVQDEAALSALVRFAESERMLVEPACAAGLAALYTQDPSVMELVAAYKASTPEKERCLVVVVCGGNMVTLSELESWRQRCS
eukprot:g61995.t1